MSVCWIYKQVCNCVWMKKYALEWVDSNVYSDVHSGCNQSPLCPPASHRPEHGQWRKWSGQDLPRLQGKVSKLNECVCVVGHMSGYVIYTECTSKSTCSREAALFFCSFIFRRLHQVEYPQISRRIAGIRVQRISQLQQNMLEERAERACNQLFPVQAKRSH